MEYGAERVHRTKISKLGSLYSANGEGACLRVFSILITAVHMDRENSRERQIRTGTQGRAWQDEGGGAQ